MKHIPLSRGKYAIVDDDVFESLSENNWHCNAVGYAVRNVTVSPYKCDVIYMHREIMNLSKGDGKYVDHRNGNQLDNRKENLRICNKLENQRNQKGYESKGGKRCSSKYKGVSYSKNRRKNWRCRINVGGKEITKYFHTEKEAAKKYNELAVEYFGEFAWLNTVKDEGSAS